MEKMRNEVQRKKEKRKKLKQKQENKPNWKNIFVYNISVIQTITKVEQIFFHVIKFALQEI